MYEDQFDNHDIYQIGKNISSVLPSRLADFKSIMDGNRRKMNIPSHVLEATTVVIVPSTTLDRNISKILNLLDSVANLTQPKKLPKVLIAIRVTKRECYRAFFELLWLQQFLDVTILEIRHRKESKTVLTTALNLGVATLYYYNPFTKKFTKTAFSAEGILFPYKLRDLNGYTMNVSTFHFPPYMYVNSNSTRHVLGIHGPEVNLMMQLSKTVNFSVGIDVSNVRSFERVNCTKEHNIGMMRKLVYNEVQFFPIQSAIIKSCFNDLTQLSRGTRFINFIVLVPILPGEVQVKTTEWNIYNTITVLCLFLMPWLIARILNFDRRHWKLMYTMQIVVGLSIPQMPRKFVERVALVSLIGYYFLQSSYIYTTFSNLQLQSQYSKKMETLEDLAAANLTFIFHSNDYRDAQVNDDDAYQKLMKNGVFSDKSFEECAKTLIELLVWAGSIQHL